MRRGVSPIILSVQDQNLQALQLKQKRGGFRVRGYGQCELAPGSVEKGEIQHKRVFSEALEQMLTHPERGHFDGLDSRLLLPDKAIAQKLISVSPGNSLSQEFLHRLAKAHFGRTSPSYQTKISRVDDDAYVNLFAVSPRMLRDYEDVLSVLKLRMRGVDSRGASRLHAFFEHQAIAEPLIDVHIGADEAELVLADQHGIHESASADAGLKQIISRIAKEMQVPPARAKHLLETAGLKQIDSGRTSYSDGLEQALLDLIRRIGELKLFYRTQRRHDLTPSLHVSGEGMLIPGLTFYLAQASHLQERSLLNSVELKDELPLEDTLRMQPLLGGAMQGYRSSFLPSL